MSVAEHPALTSKSPRRIPVTVRLGPQVVVDLCTHPGFERAQADDGHGVAGLLFGTAERDVLSVEAFKVFPAGDATGNGSPKRERLDAAFERSLAAAKTDPDLTSLHLVGWYCIRCPGDIAPLFDSDIEFHNRRFRRATDVALILKPKQPAGASIELYSRSSLKRAISRQDYRSGSLLVGSAARVNAPSDVVMRGTIDDDDDDYLRVFQVLDSLDRAERREGWKSFALRLKTITSLSLRPEWMRSRAAPDVHTTAPDSSGLPAKARTRRISLPDRSTSPQVNSPLPGAQSAQTKLRWISSAVLLVLAMGVALAWFYAHRAPASTPLDMRVEPQVGGSLLVKWDAHSVAVQSAKNGTMHIDDGSEQRNLHLDSNQVANGSILYTPSSRDLTFQLEVYDGNGAPTSESMRVVDGSKAALAAHTIPNARPSTFAKATPVPNEKPAFRQLDTTSHANATTLAGIDKTPGPSRTMALSVIPPPTRKVPAPEPKIQAMRKPVPSDASESTVGDSKKTNSSSGKPELRRTVQELPPTQSPVSSPQPAAMNNSRSARYVPPQPLKEVMPSTNHLASSVSSGVTDVEVEVRIDDEGRVTEAREVNNGSINNQLLTSAALAAAREWIFEPAKMHGKSVFSDHTIKFHFHPQVGPQ